MYMLHQKLQSAPHSDHTVVANKRIQPCDIACHFNTFLLIEISILFGVHLYLNQRNDGPTNHRHWDVIPDGFIPREASLPGFSLLGQCISIVVLRSSL